MNQSRSPEDHPFRLAGEGSETRRWIDVGSEAHVQGESFRCPLEGKEKGRLDGGSKNHAITFF